MFPTYLYYLFIPAFILLLSSIECLVQLSSKLENLPTEVILRETINKLFSSLKLRNINILNSETRSNQYLELHKYFMSVSLQDFHKRNELKNISKVGNLNNITANYVSAINDVLNEGNAGTIGNDLTSSSVTSDNDVVLIIEYFLKELEYLKKEYAFENAYHVNINTDVLKHLRNVEPLNTTNNILNISVESDVLPERNQFWEPSGRRVFKGKNTKIKHFPFVASIHIFNSLSCAGSIISSDLIITACSCLQLAWNNRFFRENPSFLSVRVGSTYYKVGGEVIPVLEVYFHPGYTPKTLKDNVCILRLTRHIIFKRKRRNVKKIIFDTNPSPLPINTDGITVIGWGATTSSGILRNPWSNRIAFSVLDIYPFQDCRDVYSREYVTRKNFCAGFFSKGGGACNKDAGGPGISGGKLIGVISFGPSVCGTPDSPTVFTKIGFYSVWIKNIMDQEVPVRKELTTLKSDFGPFSITSQVRQTTTRKTYNSLPITKSDTRSMDQINGTGHSDTGSMSIDIDPLRITHKKLFQEFLSTMFNDKVMDKYKDLLDVIGHTSKEPKNIISHTTKGVTTIRAEQEEMVAPRTKMMDSETYEVTETNNPTTLMIDEEYETAVDEKLLSDKEISQMISHIDLEKIIQQEVIGTDNVTRLSKDPLFYISDYEEENNNNDVYVEEKRNNNDGYVEEENYSNNGGYMEEENNKYDGYVYKENNNNNIGYVEEENNNDDSYVEKENNNNIGYEERINFDDLTRKSKPNSISPEAGLFNFLSEALQEHNMLL